MPVNPSYGLEQARIQLPAIAANAHAGVASIITRHGKPYAAIVPVQDLQKLAGVRSGPAAASLQKPVETPLKYPTGPRPAQAKVPGADAATLANRRPDANSRLEENLRKEAAIPMDTGFKDF